MPSFTSLDPIGSLGSLGSLNPLAVADSIAGLFVSSFDYATGSLGDITGS